MPRSLVESCHSKGIDVFVIAFEGHTDPLTVQGLSHIWTRLGAMGTIIKTLQAHDIRDVVMIGGIKRPGLSELRPDLTAASFIAKHGFKSLGDDGLLSAIRSFLEGKGFRMHGAHRFMNELLAPSGVLGSVKPNKQHMEDIEKGVALSQKMGALDVGQSVIIQDGLVLGVEAIEGTDELLRRCKGYKRKGAKGVLVKTCKPQQDRDLDLPTIGPQTIENAAFCDLAGIAVHAGQGLISEQEKVIELANNYKLFVIGIDITDEAPDE